MSAPTLLLAFAFGAAATSALAQTSATTPSASDPGATIATQGAGGPPCAGCHGAHGEGNAAGGFPRLAAQPAAYLARQLDLYANGQRSNAVMSPIAQQLKPEQRQAVAQYYASLDTDAASAHASAAAGRRNVVQLVTVGDERRDIQGCVNCHGPQGVGEPPLFPALASQVPAYTTQTLHAWKSGTRKTDPSQQMNHIAAQLTDAEITAIAQYFATQPAPRPAVEATSGSVAAGAPSAPSARITAEPKQGVGVEQGSPTTGGGQGIGGGGAASGAGPSGSPDGSTAASPANGASKGNDKR